MTGPIAIGLDIGLSTTKAVAFDTAGAVVASAQRDSVNSQPQPRWVERDPDTFRAMIFDVLGDVAAQLPGADIVGVSQAAHGDGVWVVDAAGRALRPGILSLDSRARRIAADFAAEPVAADIVAVTGQVPMISSAPVELRWLKEHEPEVYARIAHVLFPKDMARFWLTGQIAQDYTEVSSGFTDVTTQAVSARAFDLYGIPELAGALLRLAEADKDKEV